VHDRGVEPLVLAVDPGLFLVELDALRGAVAAVNDGRDLAGVTQAAARTLPLVLAAGGRDLVRSHRLFAHLPGYCASRRDGDAPATREADVEADRTAPRRGFSPRRGSSPTRRRRCGGWSRPAARQR